MTISSAHHHGLYYPQDPITLAQEARPSDAVIGQAVKALLLPHAAWSQCLPLLHHALAHTQSLKTSLILLLAPYHGGAKNLPLMVPKSDALALPHAQVLFATQVRTWLASRFPLAIDDAPFEDESSWELLMPLLDSYHPAVPILPILASDLTRDHRSRYTALLDHIYRRYPDTLTLITANANEPLPSPQAEEGASAFLSWLTGAEERRNAPISACNQSALHALQRQRWIRSMHWRPIGLMCEGRPYEEIPPSLNDEGRHVWHIAALLEEP